MRNGKIHGRTFYDYEDGRKELAEYQNGKKHGRFRKEKNGKAIE